MSSLPSLPYLFWAKVFLIAVVWLIALAMVAIPIAFAYDLLDALRQLTGAKRPASTQANGPGLFEIVYLACVMGIASLLTAAIHMVHLFLRILVLRSEVPAQASRTLSDPAVPPEDDQSKWMPKQ